MNSVISPLTISDSNDIDRLDKSSFVECHGNVIFRCSSRQVCNLYDHDGKEYDAVVEFRHSTGRITVSLKSSREGFSCKEFMEELIGPEVNGSNTYVWSVPEFTFGDARIVASSLSERLR